jgi:predicted Zn-dependent protease
LAVQAARGFGAPGIGASERDRYLKAIDGLSFGPNPNNGAIAGQQYIHPNLGFIFSVPNGYALSNGNSSVVAVAKDGTAARFDSVFVPEQMDLADYVRSGWVSGLDEKSVKSRGLTGGEMVVASAKTSDWAFEIAAIRFNGQVYRFIFAGKHNAKHLRKDFDRTLESFRKVRPTDLKQIQQYVVRVVDAKGTSAGALISQMQGVSDASGLFHVLNGLLPGDQLVPGQQYKIVVKK